MALAAVLTGCEQPGSGVYTRGGVVDPGWIGVRIQPYYDSGTQQANFGEHDKGLTAKNNRDFVKTIAAIRRNWGRVDTMTLLVGSVELYNRGYRDEAVRWFREAKAREEVMLEIFIKEGGGENIPDYSWERPEWVLSGMIGEPLDRYSEQNPEVLSQILRDVARSLGEDWVISGGKAQGFDEAVSKVRHRLEGAAEYYRLNATNITLQRRMSGEERMFSGITSRDVNDEETEGY